MQKRMQAWAGRDSNCSGNYM